MKNILILFLALSMLGCSSGSNDSTVVEEPPIVVEPPPEPPPPPEPEPEPPPPEPEPEPPPPEPEPEPPPPEPEPPPSAADVVIGWDIPVMRESGDFLSLSEIGGFKVYLTTDSFWIPTIPYEDIPNNYTSSFSFYNLIPNVYYVYVTTYDVNGDESKYSDVLIFEVI